MRKQKILVVLGSTRPGRQGKKVADWFMETATQHTGMEFAFVDLAEMDLPLFDEPLPPAAGKYEHEHTKQWNAKAAASDGFIFITPEYNHGMPAAMKNALDFAGNEWAKKPIGFVGYGFHLGVRSVAQLRMSVINLDMVPIKQQVEIDLGGQPDDQDEFIPSEKNKHQAENLIKATQWWSETLSAARANTQSS